MQDQLKLSETEVIFEIILANMDLKVLNLKFIEYRSDRIRFEKGGKMYELKLREVKK